MQLRNLALCLALIAGCKDGSTAAPTAADPAAASDTSAPSAYKGRSGHIDLQVPRRPSLDSADGAGSEARRDRRAERMKKWDTDGDGKLSKDERDAMRAARRDAMVKRLDTDGDGVVSDAERAAAQKQRAEDMHGRYDVDGDGTLTVDELGEARWFRGDPAAADTDGDGKISVDELQKAMQSGRRGRRGDPAAAAGSGDAM